MDLTQSITLGSARCEFCSLLYSSPQLFHQSFRKVDEYIPTCSFDNSDKWKQAEILMSDYRNVLERREELTLELASMERQNMDMEKELAEKLREKVNDELAFPPSSVISEVGKK